MVSLEKRCPFSINMQFLRRFSRSLLWLQGNNITYYSSYLHKWQHIQWASNISVMFTWTQLSHFFARSHEDYLCCSESLIQSQCSFCPLVAAPTCVVPQFSSGTGWSSSPTQQCLAGSHAKEVLAMSTTRSICSMPSSLPAANTICGSLGMYVDIAGGPWGLPERAVMMWSTQELLWMLGQSQIPLPLTPHDEYVWDVKAGRWQTPILWVKSWSRRAVSQKWKTIGAKYTHRHWLENLVVHGKDCLCLLEMTWRWPVANNTEMWANKRVNQTVRSWRAQIKMSKP